MAGPPRLIVGAGKRVLLVCDHASNGVPAGVSLGVPEAAMVDHVAWDIGAAALTERLAADLAVPGWLATVSRLVIDCNRPPEMAIPRKSDGIIIPGNVGLSKGEIAARLALHTAFHDGLARLIADNAPVLLVSIHSFTPALASAPVPRPWPVGVLWNEDYRGAELAIGALEMETGLGGPVGSNEPYSGKVLNYTMDRHAEAAGIPYIGFEVRQDLIREPEGVSRWAGVLARAIRTTLEGL